MTEEEQTLWTMRETCARAGCDAANGGQPGQAWQVETVPARAWSRAGRGTRVMFDAAEVDAVRTFTPAAVEVGKRAIGPISMPRPKRTRKASK
jgi:hypothetical protein